MALNSWTLTNGISSPEAKAQAAWGIYSDGVSSPALKAGALQYLTNNNVDPTPHNSGEPDATSSTDTSTTPTSNYTPNYAQQNASVLSQLAQSGNTIQSALDRLPAQLQIALGNIDSTYNQKNNELQSAYNQNENSYNTSTTQNQQNFRSNKNTINDQASSGLRGLQRLLGARGAVGSDMGLAGQAVADVASQQNAGAGQTYAQNQSGLDTNWGNYKLSDEQEHKKLADWQTQQQNSARSQSDTTKQDLLSKMADIKGQMGAARGGSYSASAQPYLDQANALSAGIDNLAKINPTYNGTTPVYTAAPLSSYSTGNGATLGTQSADGTSLNTPWLNTLLGKDKKTQYGY